MIICETPMVPGYIHKLVGMIRLDDAGQFVEKTPGDQSSSTSLDLFPEIFQDLSLGPSKSLAIFHTGFVTVLIAPSSLPGVVVTVVHAGKILGQVVVITGHFHSALLSLLLSCIAQWKFRHVTLYQKLS
uniref:Uncharacterized protein n=1 Tax=Moniliophthora roreri TaxID=221103 RepID=A0A0W0G6U6_MONRR